MKKLKSENGAIAILVLISLVFLTTFLISSYVIMSNKMQSQRKVISDTKDIYENYDLNQMYESYFDKSRDGLPDNVEQLEYIESTGTQYIDTGVFPSNNLKINIKACYTAERTAENLGANSYGLYFLGSDNGNSAGVNVSWDSSNKTQGYRGVFGSQILSTSIAPQINVPVTITLQNNKIYVNGQQKGSGNTQDVSKYSKSSIYLFCTHRGGEVKQKTSMRLYELQMYNGDTLIRDFIPVLDQNNVAYLYDKVEKKFYYNSGTGTFNYKKKDSQNMQLTKVNYIESTGTQYIDTGVKLNQNSKVEMEIALAEGMTNIFGSRTSATQNNFTIVFASSTGVAIDFQNYSNNRLLVDIPVSLDSPIYYSISKDELKIGDTVKTVQNYSSFETPQTAYIFDISGNPWIKTKAKGRLYYCKIYDGDTLVRDFVPVIDGSNIACLYDRVEKKCYYNAGTGTFSYGE